MLWARQDYGVVWKPFLLAQVLRVQYVGIPTMPQSRRPLPEQVCGVLIADRAKVRKGRSSVTVNIRSALEAAHLIKIRDHKYCVFPNKLHEPNSSLKRSMRHISKH